MLSFREVEISDAKMILDWRVQAHVTRFMNTDIGYDLDAQKQWVSSCYTKTNYYHWIILYKDNPVGLINIQNYSSENGTTSWGFYLGQQQVTGLGAFILPFFIILPSHPSTLPLYQPRFFTQTQKL